MIQLTKLNEFAQANIGSSISMVGQPHGPGLGRQVLIRGLFCNTVVGATMFLYDYLLTLGMEVDLVWSSKWTFMKVLYLAQRYLPFVDAVALCLLSE